MLPMTSRTMKHFANKNSAVVHMSTRTPLQYILYIYFTLIAQLSLQLVACVTTFAFCLTLLGLPYYP